MNDGAYRAIRHSAAYIKLPGRGNIRATGEDRVRLLHAMTTNHVQQLVPGSGCYAFFLTSQGRILSDVNLFCMTDYLMLDTLAETRRRVYEHLDKYIIADDVTLHDFSDAMTTIAVEGPDAEKILCAYDAPTMHADHGIAEWGHRLLAHISYTGSPGFFVYVPTDEVDQFVSMLGDAPEADMDTAEVVRLENGKPLYGVDILETSIPQETQQMHAVHFTKGCYLGQEIVERVRSRGRVNKLLVPIEVETETPPVRGTKVMLGGAEAGEVTSAAFSPMRGMTVGLAILRAEALSGDLRVDGAIARAVRAPIHQ